MARALVRKDSLGAAECEHCLPYGRAAMKLTVLAGVLLVLVPRICCSDGYFRCGSWLVSADMSVTELLQKCGDPTSKQSSTEDVHNFDGAKVGTSTTEVWRYDRGSRAAPMVVTIVDGKIRSIE